MLIELSRYQRGQAEFLFDFIRWLKASEVVNDDMMIAFIEDFGTRYNLDNGDIELLADYIDISARDYIGDDKDLTGYLIYKSAQEKEAVARLMESDVIKQEIKDMVIEEEYNNLPPHILNLIEKHPTLDTLADELSALNTTSTLGAISLAFGFDDESGLIALITTDFSQSEELTARISELNTQMPFDEYVKMVGGENAEVALDAMRIDILKTVAALTS